MLRARRLTALLAGLAAALALAAGPAAAQDLLDRARNAVQEAGKSVEQAAKDAGRNVSDYLVDHPELNRDLVDLGKELGLPGFDQAGPTHGPELIARPSPVGVGGTVELTATGLPGTGLPGTAAVTISAGASAKDAKEIAAATTTDRGTLQAEVKVPETATGGTSLLFVVETADQRARLVSEPIEVVVAADIVTVTGTLSNEGVECQALRGDDGVLYTFTRGDLASFAPGDRVTVKGTVVPMSICMQGTTLSVISLTAAK